MAYREALPRQPDYEQRIDEFDESIQTLVPADHFLQSQQHQDPNQQSQLPLGSVASPPP